MSLPPPPPSGPPDLPPLRGGRTFRAPLPFTIGDAMNYAWTAFFANAAPLVLITVVIMVVNIALSIVTGAIHNVALSVTMNILSAVVSLLLGFGLIRAALAVTRGETPRVGMLVEPDGFGPYLVASVLFGVGVFAGLILLIVPGIIVAVVYMFYGYVLCERPDQVGPVEALRAAADISRGHRWPLFGLTLLLALVNLVGLMLCGIGVLLTYGLTALAVAYAYRTLTGQGVAPAR